MKTLLIDNTDSFTWNLAQQIRSLGVTCDVVGNADITVGEIRKMNPDRIVLSPGPGSPEDAGVSLGILRELSSEMPILGVCLGHQCMAHIFGGSRYVGHAKSVMHGKTSLISHTGKSLFQGIPSPFSAARYHSLIVKKLPNDFELLAWTGHKNSSPNNSQPRFANRGSRDQRFANHCYGIDGDSRVEIMAMRHSKLPIFGVQFHPESFLTEHGEKLMNNFLTGRW